MQVRLASILVVLFLGSVMSCKKTNDPTAETGNTSGTTTVTPTSMVGNWKVTAFTFDPAAPINGSTERYTDYVQYLKRINETCLTDVVWTFTEGGSMSTNMSTVSTCGANGPNSTFIVNYLVEPGATYVEAPSVVAIRGKDNQTGLLVAKTFASGNLVSLKWEDTHDISNQNIRTNYTLTLKKQ